MNARSLWKAVDKGQEASREARDQAMGMLGLETKSPWTCKPARHLRGREDEREESGSGLALGSQLQHAPAEAQGVIPQGNTLSILPG